MTLFKCKSIKVFGVLFFIVTTIMYANPKLNNPIKKHNWYHSYLISTSKNGQWIHYTKNYLDGTLSASIQNIDTSEKFDFPNGSWGKFSDNNKWFAMPSVSNSLIVVDLTKSIVDTLSNVKSNYFSHTGDYLITQSLDNSLMFLSLTTKKVYSPGKSSSFKKNPLKNLIAMALSKTNGESLQIFDLEPFRGIEILGGENLKFEKLTWNATGEKLAFLYSLNNGNTYNVGLYDLKTRTTRTLENHLNMQENIANTQVSISVLGDKVFFYVYPKQRKAEVEVSVEIWDTFDPILYPRKQFINSGKNGPWLKVWYPYENRVVPLATKEMPQIIFNANSNFVLNFDAYKKEPQFNSNPFVDIYVMDIRNGAKKLAVANQYIGINFVHFSPEGKYFAYFKDNNWWLYDIQAQKNINLTIDLPATFNNVKSYSFSTPDPFGLAGWTKDDEALFIYDEFDVWKISINTKKEEKLTKGRSSKTVFRIANRDDDYRTNYGDLGFQTFKINDQDGIILSAKNQKNLEMGFYQLKDSKNIRQITSKDKRLSNLHQLSHDKFLYEQQGFNEPTSIELIDLKTDLPKTIFKSNPEWNQFKWPNKMLINYNTEFADSLKGILIYPLEYELSKKYPMIVHVYEEQASIQLSFSPPSPSSDTGFNYMNYALNGYFVLLPDIQYQHNAPGFSATVCVERAVEKALETAPIDKNKIGLIGHSFGGYETAFIITQTDMFATAVVGSGILNLISFYFDIYKMTEQPEFMRVEQVQFRMKDSYFENPNAYKDNSPIHQSANINTPVMIWAGKEDVNVNSNQSLQWYLALRRLTKPGVLYYYKDEDHVLNKMENKIDLTNRIKEWFDSYLK